MSGSQSLERGLEILEMLDTTPEPLGVREISRRMGLSPTIVQRLMNTLSQHRYIDKDPVHKKYIIGYKTFGLGWRLTRDDRLISAAFNELQALSSDNFLNMYLGVAQGNRALYLLAMQSQGPVAIKSTPGSTTFLHSTAMGKVLLAYMAPDLARDILDEPLPKITEHTVTDVSAILDELDRIRREGFSIIRGENIPGITSVGVPIFDFDGKAVASISAAYPDNFFSSEGESEVFEITREAGRTISQKLGYGQPPQTPV